MVWLCSGASLTVRPRLDIVRCNGRLSDTAFQLRVTGNLGERYLIQGATNIANTAVWTDLATLTNVLGTAQYDDAYTPTRQTRYYRARLLP